MPEQRRRERQQREPDEHLIAGRPQHGEGPAVAASATRNNSAISHLKAVR